MILTVKGGDIINGFLEEFVEGDMMTVKGLEDVILARIDMGFNLSKEVDKLN